MIDRITIGAAVVTGTPVAGTGLVRWAVTPPRTPGRHRGGPQFVPLDDLLGPPSDYTSYRTLTDVPASGPITPGFGVCVPCGEVTAGSHNRDGFLCGVCFTPAAEVRHG